MFHELLEIYQLYIYVYIGEFKHNKKDGKGKYTYKNGDIYIGDFSNGVKHGNGEYFNSTGEVYKGQFMNGKKQGIGKYKFIDGSEYLGDFNDDHQDGKGTYKYSSGAIYVGQWKNGEFHGHGSYLYPSGDIYEGEYFNGKICGDGIYQYKNGEKLHNVFSNYDIVLPSSSQTTGGTNFTNTSLYVAQQKPTTKSQLSLLPILSTSSSIGQDHVPQKIELPQRAPSLLHRYLPTSSSTTNIKVVPVVYDIESLQQSEEINDSIRFK